MAMGGCGAKRGFFVLRDCGNPAMNACGFCTRPVCGDHYLLRGNTVVCHDCNVRQQQLTDDERLDWIAKDGARNRLGFHAYRHSYYTDSGYTPFYLGLYYDRYYDAYDARAFDKRQTGTFDGDDDDGPGFADS